MNRRSISDIQRDLHKYIDNNVHKNKSKLEALKSMGSYGLGGKDIQDIKAEMYDNQ